MIDYKIIDNYDRSYKELYNIIVKIGAKKCTIGFPTGNTAIPMYAYLTKNPNHQILWKNITIFMLDVLFPQLANDPLSYYTYIKTNLLNKISLPLDNFHILDSACDNPNEECQKYEAEIRKAGGLDLVILGLGQNGHIAFNEPGTNPDLSTHKTALTNETININSSDNKNYPTMGLTMGIKTIMSAKKIILLAQGENKARAVFNSIKKTINPLCPASFLQNHPDCTYFLDTNAAKLLI